ncbi:hypothetical protein ACLKA6_001179 [Drosophila palustris]
MWIKNISALVSSQTGNPRRKQWFCNVCLNFSSSEAAALNHKELCNGTVSALPKPHEATLKFTNHHHQLQVPFVVYADFECVLQPKNIERGCHMVGTLPSASNWTHPATGRGCAVSILPSASICIDPLNSSIRTQPGGAAAGGAAAGIVFAVCGAATHPTQHLPQSSWHGHAQGPYAGGGPNWRHPPSPRPRPRPLHCCCGVHF